MTAIDYSSGPRITNVGDHTVYTKANWADAWVAQPNLVCTECSWQAAPAFNSALLAWRTGYIIMPGDVAPTLFGTWVGRGQFVKVEWSCDDASILRWVGYIDQSAWPSDAFGDQALVCFGLERALALTPIFDMMWLDGADYRRSAEAPNFGLNRSNDPDGVNGVYVFASPRDDVADIKQWSTKQIVRYLLKYNLPTDNLGIANIPWAANQIDQLPDWDAPTVECRGKTVWDVLCELIHADRQLGMTFGSDGSTAYIRFFTHTSADITFDTHTLPANPNQHTLTFAPDALTNAQFADVGGGFDQVVCRGAKRLTVCTLGHNSEIENGWSAGAEIAYEAAASTEASYVNLNTDEQRVMNAEVRTGPLLRHVYSEFQLKADWDWTISDENVFDDNDHPRTVRLLDRLPIKQTEDWSGATVDQAHFETSPGSSMLVLMANPDDLLKYVDVTKFALSGEAHTNSDRPHDVSVSAETEDAPRPKFLLKVHGAPNHAIAGTNFAKLPVDTMNYGGLDYTTLKVTLALEEDRYCEGKYPATPTTADVIRRLYVDCGDQYRQIKIHKNTIAGLDATGTEKTVTASGYLQDYSDKLHAIAQMIALGAVLTRKQVNWTSQRRISTIAVGDMITTAAGASVLAPVTLIRISAPTSVNRSASCPTQVFETFGGTQDPLNVLRRLGMLI